MAFNRRRRDVTSEMEHVIDRLEKKDELVMALGDTLDVKASIVLVLLTVLATQTGTFLVTASPDHILQVWSAAAQAIAGVLALFELWPREYAVELPEQLKSWVDGLHLYYAEDPDGEKKVSAAFEKGLIERATERIQKNTTLNDNKVFLLEWSFRFTGVAFLLNLSSLLLRVLPMPSPF
jgi:hypothetical protein